MTRRNPFEELEQLFERMSKQVDPGDWGSFGQSVPADVVDLGETIEITVDLPGFEREEIDLTLGDGSLRVQAEYEHEDAEEDPARRYMRRERSRKTISRSIRIPDAVDEDEATATLQNGVLTVNLPKVDPDAGSKQIDIT